MSPRVPPAVRAWATLSPEEGQELAYDSEGSQWPEVLRTDKAGRQGGSGEMGVGYNNDPVRVLGWGWGAGDEKRSDSSSYFWRWSQGHFSPDGINIGKDPQSPEPVRNRAPQQQVRKQSLICIHSHSPLLALPNYHMIIIEIKSQYMQCAPIILISSPIPHSCVSCSVIFNPL